MRFYYNIGLRLCAEEDWVADYLYIAGSVESREEAVEELRSRGEFCGWFECEVSGTIEEKFM